MGEADINLARVDGYVAEIDYLYGFYRELGPSALNLVLAMQGLEPVPLSGGFSYCELGCGHGLSANIFAACHPEGRFHAIDFNHNHICSAQELSHQAKLSNATFWEASFADLERLPLPDFDFIVMHGVYSWVNAENRRYILEFIRRKLKSGGVVYVSYNTMAGWASFMPVRESLISYADAQSGTLQEQIGKSVAFLGRLQELDISYFSNNPQAKNLLEWLSTCPSSYLAHELFNRDWNLFYHTEVANELITAGLAFAGSATLVDNIDFLRFSPEETEALNGLSDPVMRESLKDLIVSQQFRRDLFAKGRPYLQPEAHLKLFGKNRFVSVMPESADELIVEFPRGESKLPTELYRPVLSACRERPCSVDELLRRTDTTPLGKDKIIEILTVLIVSGRLMPAAARSECIDAVKLLNHAILERTVKPGLDIPYLASPVVRSAVKVDWLTRALLLHHISGNADPLSFACAVMTHAGYPLLKDGVALQSSDAISEELERRVQKFRTHDLPWLTSLKIV